MPTVPSNAMAPPASATTNANASAAAPPVLATQIAAEDSTTCARMADGSIRCWGDNGFNQIDFEPSGAMEDHAVRRPKTITGLPRAAKVVVGPAHACALLEDATVRCWGSDDGALGLGTPDPPGPPPITPQPMLVLGLKGVVDLVGKNHLCAILGDASVSCWHDYDSGAGDPRDAGSRSPVKVPLFAHAVQLGDGRNVSCAVMPNGKAKCWRDVSPGLIPRGKVRVDPVEIPGMGEITAIAAGTGAACGITKQKTVRCWGQPAFEHPDGASVKTPAYAVPGLSGVTSIALDGDLACVIVENGDVLCDGADYRVPHHAPVKVEGVSGAVEIAVGTDHACARTNAGAVFCWGDDDKGQLGDGGTAPQTRAVPVAF